MRNFILQGDTLDVAAPSNVLSGQFVQVGNIGGVATTTALSGTTFALKTTGVFEFPKVSTETWAVGAIVYWDATNLVATIVAGANKIMGRVAEPVTAPGSVGRVLLSRFGV